MSNRILHNVYLYDIMNEISNKLTAFGGEGCQHSLYIHIVKGLIEMLNSTNEMVKLFRSARDSCFHYDNCNYKLRLLGRRLDDVRQFDDPTSTYIGGLAVGDIGDPFSERDIIFESHFGSLQQISKLHPKFMALKYPLLFPYGEDGFRNDS